MDAGKVFLENVGLIDRIAAFVCRRHRLQPADADEFRSHVSEKLIENDYAILRKFEGRSSLSTYLTTVIQRLFFHYRVQMWGKWRPSAEAKRLGDAAILLERMLTRDGYTLDAAVFELTSGEEPICSRQRLEAIYLRLPQRQPRPVLVSDAMSAAVAAPSAADDELMHGERVRQAREVAAAIDRALESFESEDQLVLRMRFWQALQVPKIAAALHCDPKKLYKRIDRLVARLRGALAEAGIPREALADLLDHGDHDLTIASAHGWEKPSRGPSDVTDGEMSKGEERLST